MQGSPFKVVSFAATFGVFTTEPKERLEDAGCVVEIVKHSRVLTDAEKIGYARDADAVILGGNGMSRRVINALPKLKVIAQHGRGVDGIDYQAAVDKGVLVVNAPGVNIEETADLAFGLILDLERHITQMNNDMKSGVWVKRAGHSLYGKTMGIIGVGDIGLAVARRAMGFGMDILGNDIRQRQDAGKTGLMFTGLNDLLKRSDVVSIHTPLTDSTRNLIGAKELRMMREDAIEKALRSGQLRGYATDVYEKEPGPAPEICELPNVLVTPHAGSATYETNLRMGMTVADNIIAVKDGATPPNLVTPLSRIFG